MKNTKKVFLVSIVFLMISSCDFTSKMDNCMEGLIEDGYSYSEAKEMCNEARADSHIR